MVPHLGPDAGHGYGMSRSSTDHGEAMSLQWSTVEVMARDGIDGGRYGDKPYSIPTLRERRQGGEEIQPSPVRGVQSNSSTKCPNLGQ